MNTKPTLRAGYRFILILGIVATCLALPGTARADRIGRLVSILSSKPDYKIRLQVVLVLTRLRSRRSVPALMHVLSDEKSTIRGLAATALGKIGDIKALPSLKARLKVEKNAFVLSELKQALKTLKVLKSGPPRGTRFYITTGKMVDTTGNGGTELVRMMSEVLLRELEKEQGIVTYWAGQRPTSAKLRKRRIKGFILDGSILSLSRKSSGGVMEVSCKLKVALSTFPGNSMRVFITRGASMRIPDMSFKPARVAAQYRDVLEGALVAAKQDLVRNYLSKQ